MIFCYVYHFDALSIEQKINYQLNKHPQIKWYIKRAYQLTSYTISPKIKSEGNIIRVSPNDGAEYFFGYYDKSPRSDNGRYMLCMRSTDTWTDPAPVSIQYLRVIVAYISLL